MIILEAAVCVIELHRVTLRGVSNIYSEHIFVNEQKVFHCSHIIFAVVLSVLRVPYSDDDVGGAEVEIWVICDVVHADVLLHTDDLDLKQKNTRPRKLKSHIQQPGITTYEHLLTVYERL